MRFDLDELLDRALLAEVALDQVSLSFDAQARLALLVGGNAKIRNETHYDHECALHIKPI